MFHIQHLFILFKVHSLVRALVPIQHSGVSSYEDTHGECDDYFLHLGVVSNLRFLDTGLYQSILERYIFSIPTSYVEVCFPCSIQILICRMHLLHAIMFYSLSKFNSHQVSYTVTKRLTLRIAHYPEPSSNNNAPYERI